MIWLQIWNKTKSVFKTKIIIIKKLRRSFLIQNLDFWKVQTKMMSCVSPQMCPTTCFRKESNEYVFIHIIIFLGGGSSRSSPHLWEQIEYKIALLIRFLLWTFNLRFDVGIKFEGFYGMYSNFDFLQNNIICSRMFQNAVRAYWSIKVFPQY